MPGTSHQLSPIAAVACALLAAAAPLAAQAEVMPWGSVPGIRVEGQLMPVGASVCSIAASGAPVTRTARELQRPRFTRTADDVITYEATRMLAGKSK